jgi:hypothetical protein
MKTCAAKSGGEYKDHDGCNEHNLVLLFATLTVGWSWPKHGKTYNRDVIIFIQINSINMTLRK